MAFRVSNGMWSWDFGKGASQMKVPMHLMWFARGVLDAHCNTFPDSSCGFDLGPAKVAQISTKYPLQQNSSRLQGWQEGITFCLLLKHLLATCYFHLIPSHFLLPTSPLRYTYMILYWRHLKTIKHQKMISRAWRRLLFSHGINQLFADPIQFTYYVDIKESLDFHHLSPRSTVHIGSSSFKSSNIQHPPPISTPLQC